MEENFKDIKGNVRMTLLPDNNAITALHLTKDTHFDPIIGLGLQRESF